MNREIKFRVWDKENNKTLYPSLFIIDVSNNTFLIPKIENYLYFELRYAQQFTGLKDKNSKDIYEGDILTFSTTINRAKPNQNFIVEYNKDLCNYGLNLRGKFGGNTCYNYADLTSAKARKSLVVGNILENVLIKAK